MIIRCRNEVAIPPIPNESRDNLAADLFELTDLAGRIGHALMREAVAELAILAHVIIDA